MSTDWGAMACFAPVGDYLYVLRRDGTVIRRIVAPNMSEDLAIAGSRAYLVYESGARKYSGADYKVRTIHHASVGAVLP